jgi:hypothetical protein
MSISIYTEIYNAETSSAIESQSHDNVSSALAWLQSRVSANPSRIGRFKSSNLSEADVALLHNVGHSVRVH